MPDARQRGAQLGAHEAHALEQRVVLARRPRSSARSRLSSAGSSSLASAATPALLRGRGLARDALAVVLEVRLRALRQREVLVALRGRADELVEVAARAPCLVAPRPSASARRPAPRRRRSRRRCVGSARLRLGGGRRRAPAGGRGELVGLLARRSGRCRSSRGYAFGSSTTSASTTSSSSEARRRAVGGGAVGRTPRPAPGRAGTSPRRPRGRPSAAPRSWR